MEIALSPAVGTDLRVYPILEENVDILLIIGILILLVALLGLGGVIGFLADIAWILLIVAVIVIAWRLITGRRAV